MRSEGQRGIRTPPWLLTVCALSTLVLSSCGSGNQNANVRILNVSLGYQSLDMYVNKNGDSGATQIENGVGYETLTSYDSLSGGSYEVEFRVHGDSGDLEDLTSEEYADQSHYTYVASGATGNFTTVKISENTGDQDNGLSGVQVVNVAGAGSLDVYLTDSSTSLTDVSPTFSSVTSSNTTTIDQGTYRLRVTGAGNPADLRLDVASITFTNEKNSTIILTSTTGGVLVNALYLPQQGSLTKFENGNARIRAAVGISDGTLVDVSAGGTALLTGATTGVIGASYSQLTAGSTSVTLTVDGNNISVADQTLAAGGDYTLLIWSNASGNQVSLVADDNHAPTTSGDLKMRILNGMSSLGDAINYTVNFSPVASGIAVGAASTAEEIVAGSDYELQVTDATNGSTLFTTTNVSLVATDVYTLFVVGGGTATVVGSLHEDTSN